MQSLKLNTDVVTNMLPFFGQRFSQPMFGGGTCIPMMATTVQRQQPSSANVVNLSNEDREELRSWQAEMESFDRF